MLSVHLRPSGMREGLSAEAYLATKTVTLFTQIDQVIVTTKHLAGSAPSVNCLRDKFNS